MTSTRTSDGRRASHRPTSRAVGDSRDTSSEVVNPFDSMSRKELIEHLEATRARLSSNLDLVEDKLNVPKQMGIASRRLRRQIRVMRKENPLGLAAAVAGTVVAVGVVGYLVVRITSRRMW